jgi:hypothetical protein
VLQGNSKKVKLLERGDKKARLKQKFDKIVAQSRKMNYNNLANINKHITPYLHYGPQPSSSLVLDTSVSHSHEKVGYYFESIYYSISFRFVLF